MFCHMFSLVFFVCMLYNMVDGKNVLQKLKILFVRFFNKNYCDKIDKEDGDNYIKQEEKQMQETSKKIEAIFKDYKTNSNIKYANVTSLNLIKKTNTLEVILYFDEYIEIKEICNFENFLKERFSFEYIDVKINYAERVEKKSIKEEWKNIIAYMSHKYPLTKSMLLLKSDLKIENNVINIELHIKGAEFLKAKKTDRELQKTIKNL